MSMRTFALVAAATASLVLALGLALSSLLLAHDPPDDGPLGALKVEEVVTTPDGFDVMVRNQGRVPQAVALVAVNAGIWPIDLDAPGPLAPGQAARARLAYHWIDGERYEVKVIGSRGAVATADVTPTNPAGD